MIHLEYVVCWILAEFALWFLVVIGTILKWWRDGYQLKSAISIVTGSEVKFFEVLPKWILCSIVANIILFVGLGLSIFNIKIGW